MYPDTRQNSTFNSTDSTNVFTECNDMYEGTVFWACFSLVCVLCGFPACVAVLWELFQKHRRGDSTTPNDVFMLNLTVLDLVYLSFDPLGVFNQVFWHIWPIEYVFTFLIFAFAMIGRPLFMTCICLDCYLAVVHPIMYRARKDLTSRVLMSIGVWAFTLVYGGLHVKFPVEMTSYVSVLVFFFTMLTIGICDFFIIRALKSSDPGGRDLHPQKKKALQIIVNSLVMTFISYFPPMVIYPLRTFMSFEFTCQVFTPMTSIIIAGSVIMPVLYLSNLNKLGFINCWCCKAV